MANDQYEPCINCGMPLGKRTYTPRHACTHAKQIESLEQENAALRKRVEELERDLALEKEAHELDWNQKKAQIERAEKAEAVGLRNREMYLSAADRAEKAEAERDEFARRAVEMELLWRARGSCLSGWRANTKANLWGLADARRADPDTHAERASF